MKRLIPIVAAALLAGPLAAAEFNAASAAVQKDLEASLAELAKTQQEIADAKIPLSKKLNGIEDEVIAAGRELEDLQRVNANRSVELNALKARVKAQEDEVKFITGLLTEFTEVFSTQIHVSEDATYRPLIDAAKAASANQDLGTSEKVTVQTDLVAAALDRAGRMVGGQTFPGKALAGEDSAFVDGNFALIGPVTLFASKDGKYSGFAEVQLNRPEPVVLPVTDAAPGAIQAIAEGKEGKLPLDTTGGDAMKIATTDETLLEHLSKGGVVIWPIVALGILSVVIGVVRYLQIGGIRTISSRELQGILDKLKEGKEVEAMNEAMAVKGPVGELMEAAVAHAEEKKEYIEEVLYEKMLKIRPQLEKWLPFVALTAATAPLLGLLGTVTGMINTFKLISVFGTGDPKTLSSGISEALITTEFGLIVAIPALLIHAVVSRKAKSVLSSMEQAAVAFINGVPQVKGTRL